MTSKMIQRQNTQRGMLQRIPEYKMKILDMVVQSDVLSKLIFFNEPDALFKENMTDEEKQDLIYSRVFPYRFVPDPVEKQGTYLTIGASGFRKSQGGTGVSDKYQSGEIIFYFFTHHDLMRTDSGVRQDLILGELEKMFDETSGIGMGTLKLRSATELWIHNNKFGGYTVSFTLSDLG